MKRNFGEFERLKFSLLSIKKKLTLNILYMYMDQESLLSCMNWDRNWHGKQGQ